VNNERLFSRFLKKSGTPN